MQVLCYVLSEWSFVQDSGKNEKPVLYELISQDRNLQIMISSCCCCLLSSTIWPFNQWRPSTSTPTQPLVIGGTTRPLSHLTVSQRSRCCCCRFCESASRGRRRGLKILLPCLLPSSHGGGVWHHSQWGVGSNCLLPGGQCYITVWFV